MAGWGPGLFRDDMNGDQGLDEVRPEAIIMLSERRALGLCPTIRRDGGPLGSIGGM